MFIPTSSWSILNLKVYWLMNHPTSKAGNIKIINAINRNESSIIFMIIWYDFFCQILQNLNLGSMDKIWIELNIYIAWLYQDVLKYKKNGPISKQKASITSVWKYYCWSHMIKLWCKRSKHGQCPSFEHPMHSMNVIGKQLLPYKIQKYLGKGVFFQ